MQKSQSYTSFNPPPNAYRQELTLSNSRVMFVKSQKNLLTNVFETQQKENGKFRIRRQFGTISPNQKGVSFALGRNELRQSGIMGGLLNTPGPGYYPTQQQEMGCSYSIGEKMKDISEKYKSTIPPLGVYELPGGLDRYGFYQLSRFKNSRAPVFTDPQLKRFKYTYNSNPGPGEYNILGALMQKKTNYSRKLVKDDY